LVSIVVWIRICFAAASRLGAKRCCMSGSQLLAVADDVVGGRLGVEARLFPPFIGDQAIDAVECDAPSRR
jgi:hypothetical protein